MKYFTRLLAAMFTLMLMFFSSSIANGETLSQQYSKFAINNKGAMFNGWVESNYYTTPRPITTMKADFTVPKTGPHNAVGQFNYFFPAITDTNWNSILQPVLTSSNNVNGVHYNSAQWTMNGWYVTHDSSGKEVVNKSKQVVVSARDRITTNTHRSNVKNRAGQYQWNIYMKDISNGKTSNFNIFVKNEIFNYAWAAVMESYFIVSCGDFITSPFTVTNFHTYDSNNREMYTNSMKQSNPGGHICNAKVIQNTPKQHMSSLTINNLS